MGRERTRKGKHFLFYPACCIALLLGLWGCTHFQEKWMGERRLARAETLLAEGKYEESISKAKEVLKLYPRTLGDEALFRMGLIYIYPRNPDQDYERSLKCFQRVIKEYPRSKLKNQAKLWACVLREIMDKERKIGGLKRKIKELQSQAEKLKNQLLRLKEIDLGIEGKKGRE